MFVRHAPFWLAALVAVFLGMYRRYQAWAWPNRLRPENYHERHSYDAVPATRRLSVAAVLMHSSYRLPVAQAVQAWQDTWGLL